MLLQRFVPPAEQQNPSGNQRNLPLAARVLYPVFGLLLSPIIASAAMSFSSVSVIANALRLRTATL
jgi:cation transport ATPase